MNTEWLSIVIGGIAGILTALGFPKLWEVLFGHLSTKAKLSFDQNKNIQELHNEIARLKSEKESDKRMFELQISQIVTSVDMLLIVISNEFDDSPNIQTAIARVKEHLHSFDQSRINQQDS